MRSSEKSPNNFKFAYFVLQRCLTRSWAMSACVLSKCYYMHANTEREKKSHGFFVWFSCPKTNFPLHLGKVCIFVLSPLSIQDNVQDLASSKRTAKLDTTILPLCQCCALARGAKEFISIRRPFMQQASSFQVVYTASKMAIGHYSCLLIRDELSAYESRQWHYWNGNPVRALTGNIRRWILFLRNKVPENKEATVLEDLCNLFFKIGA